MWDEIWSFVGAKKKNATPEQKAEGWEDAWTWTAIDADSQPCVSYLVGGGDAGWALDFMQDCASRINGRVQVTMDSHRAYLEAVEGACGMDVDHAMLAQGLDEEMRRYSPAKIFIQSGLCKLTHSPITQPLPPDRDGHASPA